MNNLYEFSKRLRRITEGCRPDMHEPNENSVAAVVSGDHLDNACGDDLTSGELVVSIFNGGNVENFNLATMIAVAREAYVQTGTLPVDNNE